MRVFRLTILLVLMLPGTMYGEGNVRFSDGSEKMHRQVISYLGGGISIDRVDSLNLVLINEGYLDNNVYRIDSAGAEYISVAFGPRYKIGQIVIDGDIDDTLEINEGFGAYQANNPADSIISSYRKRGYFYAAVAPQDYSIVDSLLNIRMSLLTGPVVTVSSLEYQGLTKTSPDLIQRYISIAEGDTITPAAVGEAARNLEDVEFVSLLSEPQVIPDPGYRTARISLAFLEKRQFDFEGSGGYVPDDDGYFLWYLNTRMRNIFGGGRDIRLMLDRREESKSIFSVGYAQPLFIFGIARAELNLATRDYRDQFYEVSVESAYETKLGRNLAASISLGWRNVEPDDTASSSQEVYTAGFGIRAGSEREVNTISGGVSLQWAINYSSRRYKISGNIAGTGRTVFNDTRNVLTVQSAVRWPESLVAYSRLVLKDVESSERPIPLSEQFLFGGPGSLRGYRNDQFAARRLIIVSPEMRWFYSRTGFFYWFYDAAWYENYLRDNEDALVKVDDIITGYGLGVNLKTDGRFLKIEFSWGEESPIDEPRLNVVVGGDF